MSTNQGSVVSECSPEESWSMLAENPDAQLLDVRTRPEWSFVGTPDLTPLGRQAALVEWRQFPNMSVNADFAEQVRQAFGGRFPDQIFLICRSGARSMEAAQALAAADAGPAQCVNVAEGFEGDLDGDRHRGGMNGWKARGLSWRQS